MAENIEMLEEELEEQKSIRDQAEYAIYQIEKELEELKDSEAKD